MRRIAASVLIALVAAGCTTTAPAAPPTQPVPITTVSTTSATTTTQDPCRDVGPDLAEYVAALGLGHLDLDSAVGPFEQQLPDPDAFADELGAECSGAFYAHSPFGETAHAVAAWDDERTHAVMGAFVKRGSLATDTDGFIAVVDLVTATYLYPAAPGVMWGEVSDWRATYALEGIAVLAGDDPMASLRAWNRTGTSNAEYPLLHMESASSWGGNGEVFTLYPSGELITRIPVRSSIHTFADSRAFFQLDPQQVSEIEAMVLATGVTEGERFELEEQNIVDAGSLWFRFRRDDLTYIGSVYAPRLGDVTPARQKVIDLKAHLTGLVSSMEGSEWVPEAFAVRVVGRGPAPEGNTMEWPGVFDLAVAADHYCMLLEGEKARRFLSLAARTTRCRYLVCSRGTRICSLRSSLSAAPETVVSPTPGSQRGCGALATSMTIGRCCAPNALRATAQSFLTAKQRPPSPDGVMSVRLTTSSSWRCGTTSNLSICSRTISWVSR